MSWIFNAHGSIRDLRTSSQDEFLQQLTPGDLPPLLSGAGDGESGAKKKMKGLLVCLESCSHTKMEMMDIFLKEKKVEEKKIRKTFFVVILWLEFVIGILIQ
ncbi:hypothetical protein NPIL_145521 [Nephila pilipes]|uniref:Uncharacterized protein n=1 Tax=Nephila pilipes TaxID=299642 RepID=A0A8X6P0P3_NEPPI|nr:hypothetical protein NPIL_145521 [Nephila pilipes]